MKLSFKLSSSVSENVSLAFVALKSNKLRTVLTILIIAIGITALMGILTAIDAIKLSLQNEFSGLGSDNFKISKKYLYFSDNESKNIALQNQNISYKDAIRFVKAYPNSAFKSVSVSVSSTATIKYKAYSSNPNVSVVGTDEQYLLTNGQKIEKGRFINQNEAQAGRNVIVLSKALSTTIFKIENPIGKLVNLAGIKYQVIGVLEAGKSKRGRSSNRLCIIPVQNAHKNFVGDYFSYTISVRPKHADNIDQDIDEAIKIFRNVRNLKPIDRDNFEIKKSDAVIKMMMENMNYVTIAASIVGLITLLGASISLMNIMLVSVKERTREIGVRKALGATQKVIRQQFLIESILIGQVGGIIGIILGIAIGNIVAQIVDSPFVVPWLWMFSGVLLCLVVGLLSGVMPAIKASKLDPIESLRYE